MKTKISASTIARTVCLILALINLTLETLGKKVLPISDEEVSEFITLAFTIITSLVAFWKNNSFTEEAIIADDLMHELKNATAKGDDTNE